LTEQIFGKNGDSTGQIFGKMVIRQIVIRQFFMAPLKTTQPKQNWEITFT